MLTIRTRSTQKDYDGFFCENDINFGSLVNLYNENTAFFLFIKLSHTDWKVRFSKLPSARKTQSGQKIYVELAGEGHKGDEESELLYNFLSSIFRDSSKVEEKINEIAQKIDFVFDKDFIDSLDDKRCAKETEVLINSKLKDFLQNYKQSSIESCNSPLQKENTVIVECITQTNIKVFFRKLHCICDKASEDEMVLVCTSKKLTLEDINSFSSQYSEKNERITILVENKTEGVDFPFEKEISTRTLIYNKKKHSKISFCHFLIELVLLCIIIFGCIYYIKDKDNTKSLFKELEKNNKKLSFENTELNNTIALNGTWISKDYDKQVTLNVQGNVCIVTGLTNYDIIYKLDKERQLLDIFAQLHTLDQIIKEYDSTIEETRNKYNKIIKIENEYIELFDDENKLIRFYKIN